MVAVLRMDEFLVRNHMNPRMADRHTHDRAAAAIWLHEKTLPD